MFCFNPYYPFIDNNESENVWFGNKLIRFHFEPAFQSEKNGQFHQ